MVKSAQRSRRPGSTPTRYSGFRHQRRHCWMTPLGRSPPCRGGAPGSSRRQHRHHAEPEEPDLLLQRRRILAPVAAAGRDRDHLCDGPMPGHQRYDLTAEAVAHPGHRQTWRTPHQRRERGRGVLLGPGQDIRALLPQGRSARQTRAAKVERQHMPPGRREPRRERLIEALRHAHRRHDQHRSGRRQRRRPMCSYIDTTGPAPRRPIRPVRCSRSQAFSVRAAARCERCTCSCTATSGAPGR